MNNKKGIEAEKAVKWTGAILLLGVVLYFAMGGGDLIKKFYGLLPDFKESPQYKAALTKQLNIPNTQKNINSNIQSPVVAIEYTGGDNDLFVFRWNPDLEHAQFLCSIDGGEIQKAWQISPWLCDGLYSGDAFDKEQGFVEAVMNAKNEKSVIDAVATASLADEEVEIKFPKLNFLKAGTNLYKSISVTNTYIPSYDKDHTYSSFKKLNADQIESVMYGYSERYTYYPYQEIFMDFAKRTSTLFVKDKEISLSSFDEANWNVDHRGSETEDFTSMTDELNKPQPTMKIDYYLNKNKPGIATIKEVYKFENGQEKPVRYLRILGIKPAQITTTT